MDKIEQLHDEILEKVKEYYRLAHQPSQKSTFTPGVSKINYAGRIYDEREMVNLVDASLEFWLTYGKYSRQFEQSLADYLGLPFTLLVNSGSSANLLAFSALTSPLLGNRQIRRGDEVITVAAAFPTTVAPILQYGAVPVFVDVDKDTANIDATLLEKALSDKTRAVFLAHTLGNPFDVIAVKDFCDKHGLWLVEDNCDALGSTVNGQLTGTFGDIGTSSFYPPHHLTMGEGGAVYTKNPLLKKIMASFRDWGRDCWCDSGHDNSCGCRFTRQFGSLPVGYDHKYVYSHFGFNLKATDLQAAVGCAQLEKIAGFTARRKHNFNRLRHALQDLTKFSFLTPTPGSDPSWFGFLLTVNEHAGFSRNDLAQYLESHLIQTRNLFSGNILRHPCFETLKENEDYRIASSLTNTNLLMNQSLWIGVYPGMTDDKIDYMADTIREFTLSHA